MALIKCKECGKEISENAVSCPNCGYKMNKESENKSSKIKTGSIVSLIACSMLLLFVLILYSYAIIPKQFETNSNKSSTTITFDNIEDNPNTIMFFYGVLVFTTISFILTILFLSKKIKNIKIYKIALLSSSILSLFLFIMFARAIYCCEYILVLSPLTNLIGAIIVFIGKE